MEIKTIKDSDTFRKICTGLCQAYVYSKVFGEAYLAMEVDESVLPEFEDSFNFLKKVSLGANFSNETNIGILVIQNSVSKVSDASRVDSVADDLFVKMGKW